MCTREFVQQPPDLSTPILKACLTPFTLADLGLPDPDLEQASLASQKLLTRLAIFVAVQAGHITVLGKVLVKPGLGYRIYRASHANTSPDRCFGRV